MNVLSLFDGIGCGYLALERANIKIDNYFASEVDESTISITNYYYGDKIKQLGDVYELTEDKIDELPQIDLLIGGSPCQDLSSVNTYTDHKGVFGEKSKLFWQYVRVLNILKKKNPNIIFLFENVGSSRQKDKDIISQKLKAPAITFNSSLLSAQNRNRVYWTNINFELPKERKNIFMQDILEENVDDKYYLSELMYQNIITPCQKGWKSGKMDINLKIARPLTATMHKMHRADTDNYVSTKYKPENKTNVRKLTPIECERLQTLPDNYTQYGIKNGKVVKISDTKRYQAIGNGWTVDVISYILSNIQNIK